MKVLARSLLRATPILATPLALLAANTACADPPKHGTTTPIEHLIVVVGENHTFDNVYGTYQPRAGQRVDNLLSK
ncbi:MAG TPA: phosphoesterase, partial [Gammaproteobacteria bacterium]|nr:phosphoesterase [Gammaproteobacteria bacterium]